MRTPAKVLTVFFGLCFLLSLCPPAVAGTIRISLPDGKPASNAQLNVLVDGKYEFDFTADEMGGFIFPSNDFNTAEITLRSSDGDGYIPVVLPSQIIMGGDLSLVMQVSAKR